MCAVITCWIRNLMPTCLIIEPGGSNLTGIVIVVDLTGAPGKVAVLLKELREGDRLRNRISKISVEIPNLRGIRSQSGHERTTRRTAKRKLAVMAVEAHS